MFLLFVVINVSQNVDIDLKMYMNYILNGLLLFHTLAIYKITKIVRAL